MPARPAPAAPARGRLRSAPRRTPGGRGADSVANWELLHRATETVVAECGDAQPATETVRRTSVRGRRLEPERSQPVSRPRWPRA
ncbi:UNVERIFIED_CONTAM: hypothetical protein LK11_16050 [Mumia flava]